MNAKKCSKVINTRIYSKEALTRGAESLKRWIDGEPKNINPLTDIPEPEMRLYEIYGNCFETKEDLIIYCENKGISLDDAYVMDYFRNIAGRSDVIRRIDKEGRCMYYAAVNKFGYGMYNHVRSVYRGEFTWEFNYGSIKEMYSQFRDRGIVFEEDIYAKIAEEDQYILKLCREKNLFNYGAQQ